MVYSKEVINGTAQLICPKCREVCPGKFECDIIKSFIDDMINVIMKGEK